MPLVRGEHLLLAGRSSDSSALSAAFPFQLDETVANVADRVPFTICNRRNYSGGPVPDFNRVPYYSLKAKPAS